jgi:hypothetical protein
MVMTTNFMGIGAAVFSVAGLHAQSNIKLRINTHDLIGNEGISNSFHKKA